MTTVRWAVPRVDRKKNPNLRYHLYRRRLSDSYEEYWEQLCKKTGASERRLLWEWENPSHKRRCMRCQALAEELSRRS